MFQIPNPNFTQIPNVFFADIAKTLKEGELRVLLVIMRQTFGWHKQWDRISLSQLARKTGMCRDAVNNSLKSLIKLGLIEKKKEGPKGQEKCWYQLVVEGSDVDDVLPSDGDESIEDSNKSYQSSKETPPSRLKRPTKETIPKEKKRREEAQAPPPSFFEYGKVKIDVPKWQALNRDLGTEKVQEMAERLNEYAEINPKRFKQYACHAAVIRKWAREDLQKVAPKKAKNANGKTLGEIEGDNRIWSTVMQKILWPYIRAGQIVCESSYWEYMSDPQGTMTRLDVKMKDFIKECLQFLDETGILDELHARGIQLPKIPN